MAGLQDIAPMVAKRWVTKAVFAPIRAAALAASQPAWPPPMTMTSKESAWESMRDFYPGVVGPESRSLRKVFHVKHGVPTGPMFHVKHG